MRITDATPPVAALTTSAVPSAEAKKKDALHHAAKDFESILMKQLLTSAHVLGKQKGGYGDMAMDALSKGISDGGGIGLAKSLEDSVRAAERASKK
jgi:Rod binding domain-containing protein